MMVEQGWYRSTRERPPGRGCGAADRTKVWWRTTLSDRQSADTQFEGLITD